MFKKINLNILSVIISGLLLYFEIYNIFSIGVIINKIFECKQIATNSFPCYGIYDIYFMTILGIVIIINTIIIVYKLIK